MYLTEEVLLSVLSAYILALQRGDMEPFLQIKLIEIEQMGSISSVKDVHDKFPVIFG